MLDNLLAVGKTSVFVNTGCFREKYLTHLIGNRPRINTTSNQKMSSFFDDYLKNVFREVILLKVLKTPVKRFHVVNDKLMRSKEACKNWRKLLFYNTNLGKSPISTGLESVLML